MILSIMMLMSLSLLVLTTLGQHLSGALLLTASEHRYLLAWENAQSSLNWGAKQSWAISSATAWQCQQGSLTTASGQQSLTSCLRPSLRKEVFLLKGEGKVSEGSPPVVLFQHVTAGKTSEGHSMLTPQKQGWLDFCPESDPGYCDAQTKEIADAKGI